MSLEIERKFLVANDSWKHHVTASRHLVDGLVSATAGGLKVRVRIAGEVATLTVKSKRRGLTRDPARTSGLMPAHRCPKQHALCRKIQPRRVALSEA